MGIKMHVKFLTSTKAILLEEKVEKTLRDLEENNYIIDCITSNISYSGDKGYMILCQIDYHEEVIDDEVCISDFDLGTGMSFDPVP